MDFNAILEDWLEKPQHFSLKHWLSLVEKISPIVFNSAGLEADKALWGSFWQGDVIGPGYRLPLEELSYLRATRLEISETEISLPSLENYIQLLQHQLKQTPQGLWLSQWAQKPLAVVAISPWLMWLMAGELFAAYVDRTYPPGYNLQVLITPSIKPKTDECPLSEPDVKAWQAIWISLSPIAKIDRLIYAHRFYSHHQGDKTGQKMAEWLKGPG